MISIINLGNKQTNKQKNIMKNLNNEEMLKALLKDLSAIEIAILRERIMVISDITKKDIQENAEAWQNGFISHYLYLGLIEKLEKHIGFDKHKKTTK